MVRKVKGVNVGIGIPKIAVPITGASDREIMDQLNRLDLKKIDLVEWRADFYKKVGFIENTLNILEEVNKKAEGKPIIFTLRTESEGGQLEISLQDYIKTNKKVSESGLVDVIDIQAFFPSKEESNDKNKELKFKKINTEELRNPSKDKNKYKSQKEIQELIKTIKSHGLEVIASYHNFSETPGEEEIEEILAELNRLGSIIKFASMAGSPEDVFRLRGSIEKSRSFIRKPIIGISMGEIGKISRITQDSAKSCISYAGLEGEVAPGQLSLGELYEILNYSR